MSSVGKAGVEESDEHICAALLLGASRDFFVSLGGVETVMYRQRGNL